jgi:transcriptional regulator with XRE-family HTH domain
MLLGERLKKERERLGISQSVFAVKTGVSRNTQYKYEKELGRADAVYLNQAAELGVDVFYVLTGERGITLADCELVEVSEFMDNTKALNRAGRNLLMHAGLAWVKANG